VVVSDSPMFGHDIPSICYGLRGLMYMQVDVEGASGDLHSGSFGGAVDNPANALCHIVAQLKDQDGKVRIPGFYDNVRKLTERERREVRRLPFTMRSFLEGAGNPPRAWGEPGFHVLERIWARPTLEVNGIWGGYQGEGAKTVLPARAGAKISMRLVPDQSPEEAERKFTAFVKKIAPRTVKVKVTALHGGSPFLCPTDAPEFQAAERALSRAFGRKPVLIREGGSIPFTATIQEALGVPVILMGFGLPDENSHAPNERLDLENYQRGILAAAYLYEELGTKPSAPAARKTARRAPAKAGRTAPRRSR
jgi:acetylornithine deacetylase/succinyl-diaminopimelate desuccinylase-like protein